jgi:hypothetical protein|nr:MAG TPA: hypothetical protein [Caudoviricetes sp.]
MSKRKELLTKIKENISNITQVPTFIESDFPFSNVNKYNQYIVISKTSENINKLSINCPQSQRVLNVEISVYSKQNVKDNNENETIVDLIENYLTSKNDIKIELNEIDFDFDNNTSNEIMFTTKFNIEIYYIK